MNGTCQKCGCTEEHACPDGCRWIDGQEDFCSACAQELLSAPIDNLSDALLVIRALRVAVFETAAAVERVLYLEEAVRMLVAHVNGEPAGRFELELPVGHAREKIWTPGDDL